jgi:hypothetical protein
VKKLVLLTAAALMTGWADVPAYAEKAVAGYILSIDLQGADKAEKTAILREGEEPLVPKLMMPLYEDDVVFLRDPASKIEIEGSDGTPRAISGKNARYKLSGEVATGDDAWSLLTAVAAVIGGEEEQAIPDNMASRGDENKLEIPMAVRGPNFITADTRKLWLAWSGGKGPYKVIVDVDGRAKTYDKIREQEFEFETPPAEAQRFTVTVKDSEARITNVVLRYRKGLPVPNEGFKGKLPEGEAKDLVYAAWMTGLHEGDWSIGAAQILRALPEDNTEAKLLLAKIVGGWKYED